MESVRGREVFRPKLLFVIAAVLVPLAAAAIVAAALGAEHASLAVIIGVSLFIIACASIAIGIYLIHERGEVIRECSSIIQPHLAFLDSTIALARDSLKTFERTLDIDTGRMNAEVSRHIITLRRIRNAMEARRREIASYASADSIEELEQAVVVCDRPLAIGNSAVETVGGSDLAPLTPGEALQEIEKLRQILAEELSIDLQKAA